MSTTTTSTATTTQEKEKNEKNDIEQQAKYKAKCDQYVKDGLTNNKTIQFLIDKLNTMGCTVPEGFIKCADCGYLQSYGAFHLLSETVVDDNDNNGTSSSTTQSNSSASAAACNRSFMETLKSIGRSSKNDTDAQDQLLETMNKGGSGKEELTNTIKRPEIFLCQQHLIDADQTNRTIVHELIHAIDACRAKVNLQSNCIHLACTEIRAENLSGECTPLNEFLRIGFHNPRAHAQECVRRRALLSVNSHPRCRNRATEYVDAAMTRCYKDIFPFERHPNEEHV